MAKGTKDIQARIVELHDIEKMSFTAIAAQLTEETGEKISRQRANKSYKSAKRADNKNATDTEMVKDAFRLIAMGHSKKSVSTILTNWGYTAGYDRVVTITHEAMNEDLREATHYDIENLHNKMVAETRDVLEHNLFNPHSPGIVRDALEYNGVHVTDKVLEQLMYEAYELLLEQKVIEAASILHGINGSLKLPKMLCQKIGLKLMPSQIRHVEDR
jgi:hypothetical protein